MDDFNEPSLDNDDDFGLEETEEDADEEVM